MKYQYFKNGTVNILYRLLDALMQTNL